MQSISEDLAKVLQGVDWRVRAGAAALLHVLLDNTARSLDDGIVDLYKALEATMKEIPLYDWGGDATCCGICFLHADTAREIALMRPASKYGLLCNECRESGGFKKEEQENDREGQV